jgi:hypothetical protein
MKRAPLAEGAGEKAGESAEGGDGGAGCGGYFQEMALPTTEREKTLIMPTPFFL